MGATVAAGFGVISAATVGGLAGAVKASADFDTAMRKAGAISGASEEQFNDMRNAVPRSWRYHVEISFGSSGSDDRTCHEGF
nr:hypothetical protein P5658_09645 [Bacillus subtilis]